MKIVITFEEALEMIRMGVQQRFIAYNSSIPNATAGIPALIHRYSDGSGEARVDGITSVDRVEISIEV